MLKKLAPLLACASLLVAAPAAQADSDSDHDKCKDHTKKVFNGHHDKDIDWVKCYKVEEHDSLVEYLSVVKFDRTKAFFEVDIWKGDDGRVIVQPIKLKFQFPYDD